MAPSPRGPVRGVVFDLDGTLVDAFDGIAAAANAARAHFGLPPLAVDEVTRHVGRGLTHLLAGVVGTDRAARAEPVFRTAYARVCEEGSRALPGAAAVLEALGARGIRSSVASNKPAVFSESILARLGLRRWLDAVEGPDTAGALKPDPAMIHACLRAMGVLPGEALYVGDMPYDAEAGRRAGVRTLLVAGGASPDDRLRATGVEILASLSALPDLVGPAGPPPHR